MVALLNLWDLLVLQVFGGFWLAVVGIALLFFVIMLMFGRMSIQTVAAFLMLFFVAMTIGYGITWITIILVTVIVGDFAVQVFSAFNKTQ